MTKIRPVLLASSLCIALVGTVSGVMADEPRIIEYAYPDQSVWTTRLDSRGEPDNPLLRLAAPLFQQAGLSLRARGLPAARLYEYLGNGQTDFSMLVKSPALEKCCLISKKPMAGTELRVYRHKSKPPITSHTDLAGKEVITIHGYSYGGLLNYIKAPDNQIGNNATVSHEAAFVMLDRGRADYLLDYAGPAEEILAVYPIRDLLYDVISRLDVHLILRKTYPEAASVMARLESIADTLRTDDITRHDLK